MYKSPCPESISTKSHNFNPYIINPFGHLIYGSFDQFLIESICTLINYIFGLNLNQIACLQGYHPTFRINKAKYGRSFKQNGESLRSNAI